MIRPGWIFLAGGVLWGLWAAFPDPLFTAPASPLILDERGEILGTVTAGDGQWRFPASKNLPDRFVRALTQFEDRRFFRHFGVDPAALLRALSGNLALGRVRSGASTLTMQVMRLSLSQERTWGAKIQESLLALVLELKYSKPEILALFASQAPFGGNVAGLEAASRRYYLRPPEDLSWAEASTLAVLPNAPGLIHPGRNRQELLEKRDRLLSSLAESGNLTPLQLSLAREEPLPSQPQSLPNRVPHLLLGGKAPVTYGKPTTLDQGLQTAVQTLTDRHVKTLEGNLIRGAAVLVVETATGKVKAYVGNRTPTGEETGGSEMDMIQALRSTGSLYKPFLYALMLESGELLPGMLVPDVPTRLGNFRPENHKKGYDGAVRAREALARSLNIPAVRELRDYGVDLFYRNLKALGVSALENPPDHYGLSLILGGSENTLWELTGLYASLGRRASPSVETSGIPSLRPRLHREETTPSPLPEVDQDNLLGRGSAWLTLEALTTLQRPGEEGPWELYASSRKIAWKTGTSQGYRDAWALGVTPEYTVGVWVGNPSGEGRPGLLGALSAAPLMFQVFSRLGRTTWFSKPWGDLRTQTTCLDSGWPAGPDCPRTALEEVPRESSLQQLCPHCRTVTLDPSGRWRVDSLSQNISLLNPQKWFILPPVQEYWYRRRHPEYRPLPPFLPGTEQSGALPFAVIFPEPESRIYIPVEMNGLPGRSVFSAAHRRPGARLFWHLDGNYLGETREIHQMPVNPGPGTHSLTLTDEQGRTIRRKFHVLDQEE